MPPPPIPIKLSKGRRALAEMFIDLTLAFHATTVPLGKTPPELDANLAVVGVAAMLGHATGLPMTAAEIAARLTMPRTTVLRRLQILTKNGLLKKIDGKFYLDPKRAQCVPHRDKFNLILAKAFVVIGPRLSKMDT